MNQRILLALSVLSASAIATMVGACGGDSSAADGGNDATTNNDGAANDSGGGDGSIGDSSVNDTGSNNCVGADGGCRACCVGEHPDGAAFFENAEITCACTQATCQQRCGTTLCGKPPKQPNGMCTACLASPDAGSCLTTALGACANDVGCTALAACVLSCGDGG